MHRRPLIANALRLLAACVSAAILSGASAVAMLAPLAKTASWGSDHRASGRFREAPSAERERISGGDAWSYESAPSRATWLSRDPIGEEGGLNLYVYLDNGPVSYVDPLGLQSLASPAGAEAMAAAAELTDGFIGAESASAASASATSSCSAASGASSATSAASNGAMQAVSGGSKLKTWLLALFSLCTSGGADSQSGKPAHGPTGGPGKPPPSPPSDTRRKTGGEPTPPPKGSWTTPPPNGGPVLPPHK